MAQQRRHGFDWRTFACEDMLSRSSWSTSRAKSRSCWKLCCKRKPLSITPEKKSLCFEMNRHQNMMALKKPCFVPYLVAPTEAGRWIETNSARSKHLSLKLWNWTILEKNIFKKISNISDTAQVFSSCQSKMPEKQYAGNPQWDGIAAAADCHIQLLRSAHSCTTINLTVPFNTVRHSWASSTLHRPTLEKQRTLATPFEPFGLIEESRWGSLMNIYNSGMSCVANSLSPAKNPNMHKLA